MNIDNKQQWTLILLKTISRRLAIIYGKYSNWKGEFIFLSLNQKVTSEWFLNYLAGFSDNIATALPMGTPKMFNSK